MNISLDKSHLIVFAFIITLFLLGAYVYLTAIGKPDATIQNCLIGSMGIWFGSGLSILTSKKSDSP